MQKQMSCYTRKRARWESNDDERAVARLGKTRLENGGGIDMWIEWVGNVGGDV